MKDGNAKKAEAHMAHRGQLRPSSFKKHNYGEYSCQRFHVGPTFVDDEYSRHRSFWYKVSSRLCSSTGGKGLKAASALPVLVVLVKCSGRNAYTLINKG